MAEHELKLKATIDTNQVQQQLGSLEKSSSGGVQINTQKLDQAFQKLTQVLNKFSQSVDQMSNNMAKSSRNISNIAGGGNAGLGQTMLKGASIHFIGASVQQLAQSGAGLAEASGYKSMAKNLKTAGSTVGNVASGVGMGASAGAAVGSIVPGFGTAAGAGVGAAIGAAVGVATSAIDYFAEKAKEAADALEQIANFKKSMESIVSTVDQHNALKIAQGGPSEARDKLYTTASANLKAAEAETNRLRDIAKHNADVLNSRTKLSEKEREALQNVVDDYKKAAKSLQDNKQIVDAINQARKQEAEKAKQEAEKRAAEEKRKAEWKQSSSASTKKAQDVLAGEEEIKEYEQKSTEELNEIQQEAKKTADEATKKMIDLLNKRQEAIQAGDEQLARDLLIQIQALETSKQVSEKKSDAIKSILDKRSADEENKSSFERKFSRRQEMEDFSTNIQKSSIESLKQILHDLNTQKMDQRDQVLQANQSGDFKNRDILAEDLQDTESKMKMVQAQIDKLQSNSGKIWEGAGQMSEMAKVGMYVSRSDQGLNDPKLQAQKEGNELLRQIKDNTQNFDGGLE